MTMIIPAYFVASLQTTTGNGEGRIANLAGHYFTSRLLPIYFQKNILSVLIKNYTLEFTSLFCLPYQIFSGNVAN